MHQPKAGTHLRSLIKTRSILFDEILTDENDNILAEMPNYKVVIYATSGNEIIEKHCSRLTQRLSKCSYTENIHRH